MTNLLQSGAAWLGSKLQAHAGRTVTIEQGTITLADITAAAVMHEYEVMDDQGFLVSVVSYDWTLVTADLVADGSPLQLRSGAILTETLEGVENKYEAMPLGQKPCVERL